MVVRAPATSANLGPAFDAAAVALELWNELEVTEGDGVEIEGKAPASSPPTGQISPCARTPCSPIRRASGSGSSTGSRSSGVSAPPPRRSRSASRPPPRRTTTRRSSWPPAARWRATPTTSPRPCSAASRSPGRGGSPVSPTRCRSSLWRSSPGSGPQPRRHAGRCRRPCRTPTRPRTRRVRRCSPPAPRPATVTCSRPGSTTGSTSRTAPSPTLEALREELPAHVRGASLSGSGPTVIAWADDAAACAAELAGRFPEHDVLALAVSPRGVL